jgi:methyl-accepting chemotaxis protein
MTISAEVGKLVDEIAAASNEQAKGIDQVSRSVAEMDKVVQQSAANSEESASAAEETNAQALHMKRFVGDLVSLVGGAVIGSSPQALTVLDGRGATGVGEPVVHEPVPAQGRRVTPKQMIPLDDGVFKEF